MQYDKHPVDIFAATSGTSYYSVVWFNLPTWPVPLAQASLALLRRGLSRTRHLQPTQGNPVLRSPRPGFDLHAEIVIRFWHKAEMLNALASSRQYATLERNSSNAFSILSNLSVMKSLSSLLDCSLVGRAASLH